MRKSMTCALLATTLAGGVATGADFGLYGAAGSLGLGGGVAASFGDHFGARLGYTKFQYETHDFENSDLKFDAEADLGGAQALVDWYPFGGGFRISAGAVENARVTARPLPLADTFAFNGATYETADIGEARAAAEFGSTAPYVGFGFGRTLSRDGRFTLTADVGLAFTGAPDVTLDVTCTSGAEVVCSQLIDDVAAEQADLQDSADDYEYWPVLSFGLSYRF